MMGGRGGGNKGHSEEQVNLAGNQGSLLLGTRRRTSHITYQPALSL